MKLAVLTGGGDAPGLNAVIRAVVRTAVYRYQDDVVGVGHGFAGLLRPPDFWPLAPGDVRGLSRRGGTILGCNRTSPFDHEGEDRSSEVLETIRWLGLDGLIAVAGEGSLAISRRLHAMGVPVVCIPKTIENDLPGGTATFGYATAVEMATAAIDTLQTTRETRHRVMYLEVSGTRAGWIALEAALAGGADVALLPELPHDPRTVANLVARRAAAGKPSTIVVVSEGARPVAGAAPADACAGAATQLAAQVAAHCPEAADYKVTVLGHLLHGGDPLPYDRLLATRFGAAAVRAVHEGAFGTMVAWQGTHMRQVPLDEVVGRVHRLDLDGELVWTARSLGISLGEPAEPGAAGGA